MTPYKMLLILALQNSCVAFFNRPVAKHTYVPPLSSHFSVISTTITDKAILKKSLLDLNNQYTIYNGPTTIVGYNKQEIEVDLAIKQDNYHDIGFKLNNNAYEMVTDLQFWQQNVPPEVFMERLMKRYTLNCIYLTCRDEGYVTESVQEHMDTGVTEIVVSRYDM